MIYTPKQRDLMRLWQTDNLKRINLLEGAVSSGKTWISLVLWAFWVATMPKDKLYLMCAKSLTTLKRNCLLLLQELVGEANFTFSIPAKEGLLFGRKILFEGANDARSESKIRGITLQGAYCDELTQFPEDFFAMLLSRLRVTNAKVIATTNPDNPNHWLKTDYIDRIDTDELNMLDVKFTIDDNTILDAEYVENIKREYIGVFYDRFIRGLWVAAEGLVYDLFDETKHVTNDVPEDGRFYISIDYGTQNPFSAGLWCLTTDKAVRINEYYYSGRNSKRQMTDEEYYAEVEKLAGDRFIEKIVIDPSAASFIACIRRHEKYHVKQADNDVLNGIRTVITLLNGGRLLIGSRCKDAIREFGLYCWDDKSTEDKVIKADDHAMDDIRYFANTILKREFKWDDWR